MKTMKLGMLFVPALLIAIFAYSAFSQAEYKVGDKVEILNLSKEWVAGTVIGTVDWNGKLMYRVELEDKNAPNVYFNHTPVDDIRPRAGANKLAAGGQNNGGQNNADGWKLGDLLKQTPPKEVPAGVTPVANGEVGTVVDGYYDKTHGKMRGVITETKGNQVKLHYRGCDAGWDEWVDRSQAHVPATISAGAPPITFLFAKWRLTKVGISSSNTAWGKADGIDVNPNGTYTWYQGAGKAPVRGRWETDAKVPGTDNGTPFYDGVLVKDAMGQDWKVFKWVVKGYPDGIQVQRLCSGEAIVGSRAP